MFFAFLYSLSMVGNPASLSGPPKAGMETPMARKFEEVKVTGNYHTIVVEMKDGKETKKVQYDRIKSPDSLKSILPTLNAEALAEVYDAYCYGVDLAARASNREASAPETTIVRFKGKEVDLMSFPAEKLIPAINAKYAALAAEKLLNPDAKLATAYATARKRLVESGAALEKNGTLTVAPKK